MTNLDPSQNSRYLPTTPFSQIIQWLLIENWNTNLEYDQYYYQCEPSSCSYLSSTTSDIRGLLNAVLATIGGLPTILKLVIPLVVKLIYGLIQKIRGRGGGKQAEDTEAGKEENNNNELHLTPIPEN
jgi:hypothetical protein